MFAAIEAQRAGRVLLVTKGPLDASNTTYAQGGMAAAIAASDSVEAHLRDTIAAGAGLVDEEAARVLCEAAPACIAELTNLGVRFDRSDDAVALGREAAHSHHRIVHSGGDRTGRGLIAGLTARLRESSVDTREHCFVTRIVLEGGAVAGVEALDEGGAPVHWRTGRVILATGGAGQLYSNTTNPPVATGDGLRLAFDAGAELADLEFFQFHPTAFLAPGREPFLISEAVRGEGAVLRNAGGEAFMQRYHPDADLAPRDIVARAIAREMRAHGSPSVGLDCTGIRHMDIVERFPGVSAYCRDADIDIRREVIPVAPAAHYLMGGVRTDTFGRTTVAGLYACGEVACTGVHGANRLASNSLMESIVFAARVAAYIAGDAIRPADQCDDATALPGGTHIAPTRRAMQELMWEACGIERDGEGLREALDMVATWPAASAQGDRESEEDRTLSLVGQLMLSAALRRQESRGAHYRRDFPERDDARWQKRQVFRRDD